MNIVLIGNAKVGKKLLIDKLNISADGCKYSEHSFPHNNDDTNWLIKKKEEFDSNQVPLILLCVSEQEKIQEFHQIVFNFFRDNAAIVVVFTQVYDRTKFILDQHITESFPGAQMFWGNSELQSFDGCDSNLTISPVHEFEDLVEMISKTVCMFNECVIMRDNAMKAVGILCRTLGRKVGWNPFPWMDQLPLKPTMKKIAESCAQAFAITFTDVFVEEFVRRKHRCGGTYWKLIPVFGTLYGGVSTGRYAHDFALSSGQTLINAMFHVRIKNSKIYETALKERLK